MRDAAVASTQDVAIAAFARTGRPTLAIADRQLAGRGRQGRSWIEPDRGMFSSFVTSSSWPSDRRTLIPLTAAVAVRRAIADLIGVLVDTKWPNDLLLGGRKVGGILVEASGERIAVGCGVNLWWNDPPSFAAALYDIDPGRETGSDLATRWVDAFLELIEPQWRSWPKAEYEASCVTLASSVSWDGGSGIATAIAPDGALVVETGAGPVAVHHGDVHLAHPG